jgi:type I restriction enzyme S subunit
MKAGWEIKKLGEVCEFVNRGVSPKYLDEGGICVLNQKCVRNHSVNFELARRHDDRAKSVSEQRLLRRGDVLVNSTGTGTLGRVAQIREDLLEPTTVDSHVTIARPKTGLFYSEFFGYAMVAIEEAIKEAGEGCGGQTELSRSVLAEKFSIQYPKSLSEQAHIVGILDEAFASIATAKANTQKNLENAKAVFESHLNSVFSNRGEGWVEKKLPQISENLDNRRIPITKSDRVSGNYPYYGASGIVDHVADFIFDEEALLVSEDGANLLMRSTPIAFSVSGRYWVNNHAHILRFSDGATRRFVELYLNSIKLDEYITGAAQPKLNQKALNSIPIYIPSSVNEQNRIVEELDSLSEETSRLTSLYTQKLSALEDLKKSLLHQAFTGKL